MNKRNMDDLSRTIECAKQQLEQMIDLNPQIMLLVDNKATIRRANTALLKLLGLSGFSKVLGRSLSDVFPGSPDIRRMVSAHSASVALDAQVNLPVIGKRTLQFTAVGGSPDMELFVVIVNDVSSNKQVAAELEQKHKKEAVNALVGALMHNINQSLTVITIQAHLLRMCAAQRTDGRQDQNEALQDILEHSQRIANILNQVENTQKYVTEPYVGGLEILDLRRSAGGPGHAAPSSTSCPVVLTAVLGALEMHDPGTLLHARRTAECAAVLAIQLGLNQMEVESVRIAGMVHDIGKIGIPDNILRKPAPLSGAETKMMQRHAEIGFDLVRSCFLRTAAEVAHCHHEQYDGSGYPQGLAGDNIPLFARIAAVADAFEVVRTGRPYRAGVSSDDTIRELTSAAGRQFDPAIIEALKTIRKEMDAALAFVKS